MEPVRVPPVPKFRLPATPVSTMPLVPLVEDTLVKVALAVPVVRFSACPAPEMVISLTVRVPKPVPAMPEPVLAPMSRPRTVLPVPRVIALVAAVVVVNVGRVPPVAGRVTLNGASVIPLMAVIEAPAPWPISSWLFRSVTPVQVRRRCRCRRRSVCPVCGFGAAPVLTAWNAARVENGEASRPQLRPGWCRPGRCCR